MKRPGVTVKEIEPLAGNDRCGKVGTSERRRTLAAPLLPCGRKIVSLQSEAWRSPAYAKTRSQRTDMGRKTFGAILHIADKTENSETEVTMASIRKRTWGPTKERRAPVSFDTRTRAEPGASRHSTRQKDAEAWKVNALHEVSTGHSYPRQRQQDDRRSVGPVARRMRSQQAGIRYHQASPAAPQPSCEGLHRKH